MTTHNHHGADRVYQGAVPKPNAGMNITPMIDVLLVLLVIFMASLPLNQRGLDVDLPPETKTPEQPVGDAQIVVEYTGDRQLSINKQGVSSTLAPLSVRIACSIRRVSGQFAGHSVGNAFAFR